MVGPSAGQQEGTGYQGTKEGVSLQKEKVSRRVRKEGCPNHAVFFTVLLRTLA